MFTSVNLEDSVSNSHLGRIRIVEALSLAVSYKKFVVSYDLDKNHINELNQSILLSSSDIFF